MRANQELLAVGELESVLGTVLAKLGLIDCDCIDLQLLEALIDSDLVDLHAILAHVEGSSFDLELPHGEAVIAQAFSGASFDRSTPSSGSLFKLHGGGQIGEQHEHASFAVHVSVPKKKGGLKGHLHYHDHAADLNLHSHNVTYAKADTKRNGLTFRGTAEVNGVSGYEYEVTAYDIAKHGRGNDTFSIRIEGPGVDYERSGVLTAGSLHMHFDD